MSAGNGNAYHGIDIGRKGMVRWMGVGNWKSVRIRCHIWLLEENIFDNMCCMNIRCFFFFCFWWASITLYDIEYIHAKNIRSLRAYPQFTYSLEVCIEFRSLYMPQGDDIILFFFFLILNIIVTYTANTIWINLTKYNNIERMGGWDLYTN